MPIQPDTLQVVADGHAVELATQWLEAIAERDAWSPRLGFGLLLSLDEVLTNIVSYAFDGGGASGETPLVTMSLRREGSDLLLEIVDNGRPYDPTRAQVPPLAATLDEARIGGHGTRLVRHYLKDIAYRSEQGRNHLTLVANGD